MNAPLTPDQQQAVHDLQCRARKLNVSLELHFNLKWQVILVVGGHELATIEEASDYLAGLEANQ